MKVEYNVKVPHNTYGNSPYADFFWEFYDSENENAKIEFDDIKEANRCQKAMCMLVNRHQIYNVVITRRKNILYLIRSGVHDGYLQQQ